MCWLHNSQLISWWVSDARKPFKISIICHYSALFTNQIIIINNKYVYLPNWYLEPLRPFQLLLRFPGCRLVLDPGNFFSTHYDAWLVLLSAPPLALSFSYLMTGFPHLMTGMPYPMHLTSHRLKNKKFYYACAAAGMAWDFTDGSPSRPCIDSS